jgi:SAM-dependent methyltransferase
LFVNNHPVDHIAYIYFLSFVLSSQEKVRGRRWEDNPIQKNDADTIKSIMLKLPPPPAAAFECDWDKSADEVVQQLSSKGFFNIKPKIPTKIKIKLNAQKKSIDSATIDAILNVGSLIRGDTIVCFATRFGVDQLLDACKKVTGIRCVFVAPNHKVATESKRIVSTSGMSNSCIVVDHSAVDAICGVMELVVPGYHTCFLVDGPEEGIKQYCTTRSNSTVISFNTLNGWHHVIEHMFEEMSLYSCSFNATSQVDVTIRQQLENEEDHLFNSDFLASDCEVNNSICPFLPSPQTRIERLASFLPISSSDHVLDIGCGDGRVLTSLSVLTGCVCTGIDVDVGLIEKGIALAHEKKVNDSCFFKTGDVLETNSDGVYTMMENENPIWLDGRSRKVTVIVMFLVTPALRKVKSLVEALWAKGGVTVVTLGAYQFEDWAYDRADLNLDVWVINPIYPLNAIS